MARQNEEDPSQSFGSRLDDSSPPCLENMSLENMTAFAMHNSNNFEDEKMDLLEASSEMGEQKTVTKRQSNNSESLSNKLKVRWC